MTLLQRGVIDRLRRAGYEAPANLAHEHWSQGEPIPGPRFAEIAPSQGESLIADFVRANKQSR